MPSYLKDFPDGEVAALDANILDYLAQVCRSRRLVHITSNDADFDRVPTLTRWQPQVPAAA